MDSISLSFSAFEVFASIISNVSIRKIFFSELGFRSSNRLKSLMLELSIKSCSKLCKSRSLIKFISMNARKSIEVFTEKKVDLFLEIKIKKKDRISNKGKLN